jgi:transposase-like protein
MKLRRWQCAGCRHQVSLTAGTILHNTKTPLTVWFWAAYLMATDKRGISALLLQRQLALRRYETAWMMLHKFRRAMVNVAREPLQGDVEVDDTWVGGPQAGLRGSRQLKGRKAALVIVAVEKRGRGTGRARMAVIPDFKAVTLTAFLKQNVAPGSTLYTDGLKSFTGLQEAGFKHAPRNQPLRIDLSRGAKSVVPLADRAIGNLQQWLIGTYHGVSRDQLQVHLDEFVFRHNRRRLPWQRSRPSSASAPATSPHPTAGYVEPPTSLTRAPRGDTIPCGLLKQPYKQKATTRGRPARRFPMRAVSTSRRAVHARVRADWLRLRRSHSRLKKGKFRDATESQ